MLNIRSNRIADEAGKDLTPEFGRRLGRAVAETLKNKGTVALAGGSGAAETRRAVAEGLSAGGCVVADAGTQPAFLADFARRLLRADALVLVREGEGAALFFGAAPASASRMKSLKTLMEGGALPDVAGGGVEAWEEDVHEEYAAWIRRSAPAAAKGRTLKAVLFAPAGVPAELVRRAVAGRPGVAWEVVATGETGRCGSATLAALGDRVKTDAADLGVALSQDGLVARLVDEKGKALTPDTAGLIYVRRLFKDLKGKKVAVDGRASSALVEGIKEAGGSVIFAGGGLEGVLARGVAEGAALTLGPDGEVAFGDMKGTVDGLYAALRLAEALRQGEDSLSKLRLAVPAAETIGSFSVACSADMGYTILNRIRSGYPGEAQYEIGGVRVRMPGGFAVVIPNEEDATLVFQFEGKDRETVEKIASEILEHAVEVRDEARRIAGLPELQRQEYAYEDYEIETGGRPHRG